MCDENNQLPGSVPVYGQPNFTLSSTGGDWNSSGGTAWSCGKCGYLIYAGSTHHCPTAPNVAKEFSIPSSWVDPPQYHPRPHVCPVCTGAGEVADTRPVETQATAEELSRMKQCPACKGACVLWG